MKRHPFIDKDGISREESESKQKPNQQIKKQKNNIRIVTKLSGTSFREKIQHYFSFSLGLWPPIDWLLSSKGTELKLPTFDSDSISSNTRL